MVMSSMKAESMTLVILSMAIGITSVPYLPEQSVMPLAHLTPPMTSALKAGDYQQKVKLLALLATAPLFRLLLAGTTTLARSALLAAATGGPLLRTIASIGKTWSTMVVDCIPSTTLVTSGSMYGVYGLASLVRPLSSSFNLYLAKKKPLSLWLLGGATSCYKLTSNQELSLEIMSCRKSDTDNFYARKTPQVVLRRCL